jgi:hypothetical protein
MVDLRRRADKANQGLTVHLFLEFACLIVLLDYLSLQRLEASGVWILARC